MNTNKFTAVFVVALMTFSAAAFAKYDRSSWRFYSSKSPESSSTVGFYTDVSGSPTDVDHVVSLYDAYHSGGDTWTKTKKRTFSNDPLNHVASVPYVNRTLKNKYVPLKFIRKMQNNTRGYSFTKGACLAYVNKYVAVKAKYDLDFHRNNIALAKAMCVKLAVKAKALGWKAKIKAKLGK